MWTIPATSLPSLQTGETAKRLRPHPFSDLEQDPTICDKTAAACRAVHQARSNRFFQRRRAAGEERRTDAEPAGGAKHLPLPRYGQKMLSIIAVLIHHSRIMDGRSCRFICNMV